MPPGKQPHLYNRVGFVDIPTLTAKALEDVEIVRQWKPGIVVDEKAKRRSADQLERGIGRLLKRPKYSKIWSRHFAASAT